MPKKRSTQAQLDQRYATDDGFSSIDYLCARTLAAEPAPTAEPGPAPTPKAAPPDPKTTDKLRALARVLDLKDGTDVAAIKEAFDKFIGPLLEGETAARRTLSAREIQMCKAKGLSLAAYAATRRGILRSRGSR